MDLVLRGGRVIGAGPRGAWHDGALDVRIRDGKVIEIAPGLRGGRELAVAGLWILPGLVDLRAHLREPGGEHKEDLVSGTRAAVAGGFTTVCAMPDTRPVNDHGAVTELLLRRSAEIGLSRVRPVGAVTRGLGGEQLAEIADLRAAGAVAIGDGDHCLVDGALLRRALEYARTIGLPLVQHALDPALGEGGVANESATSTRLGLRPQPAAAESAVVARDLELVAWTGARYHVAHVSAARTVELLREARRRGLPVTAEVSPHHLTLTEAACAGYDPFTKVTPPLRGAEDRAALLEGLADGTIDAVATSHAPHAATDKDLEFEAAAPGMIGLETALAQVLGLVRAGQVPLRRAVEALTVGPALAFGLDAGRLHAGAVADLAIVDPDRSWTVRAEELASKSKNTPLLGHSLVGRAVLTLVGGRAVLDRDQRLS